ncbi:uncharacterized protein FSUBG_6144 [Fusarium subglutinans]|uniref:Uncharacterized protein n=1 Tax=Gibberella subglutinans TaxID=42677 RepID=A0A8H5PZP5_GIBSU|nr:uncharacterized protein FSUBG_6144 [Fusarium subglutinans]KAF5606311.1 hypothetical protein FSUBG_6144 [Fusarium subglutinans]
MDARNTDRRLRARQFQRFYHHKPPLQNRDLITDAILKKANYYEPNYNLSQCAPGEVEFEPKWTENRASLRSTVNTSFWKEAFNAPEEEEASETSMASAASTSEDQNSLSIALDGPELPDTTATSDLTQTKTMKYLRSVLDTLGTDGMPGGWGEEEEFLFTNKQVARYLRWTKKEGEGPGKE